MSKYTKEDILRIVKDEDVEFIRMQFTDIFGQLKNVAVTSSQLEKALNNQIMIDGSSIEGFTRIHESDQYLRPDLDSFTLLPWRPQSGSVARFICDGHFERHLRRTCARNGQRRAALVAALDEELGDQVEVLGANAGLHVMLRLRDVPLGSESELIAAAERAGVRVYSPAVFYRDARQRPEAELLLGYASLSLAQIRRGIVRLADVLAELTGRGRGRRSVRR